MGNVGTGIARTLIDEDGDSIVDASANALKVKLVDSDDIDIGNVVLTGEGGVSIKVAQAYTDSNPDLDDQWLLGTHALLSARSNSTTTLGITCEDGTHNALHVAISDGAGIANVDGNNNLNVILASNTGVDIGDVDVTSIVSGTGATNLGKAEDDGHTSGDVGVMALAVRNNTLGTLVDTNTDYAPLQVNTDGALYTYTALNTDTGTSKAFQVGAAGVAAGQTGVVSLARMNDVVAAPSGHSDNEWSFLQVDLNGSLYTTHGVTGGADGVTTDDTSGTVLGGDVDCKKVDIQAQTDNTGVIAVGFTGVDATVATGTGILLNAGDVYSLEINNLNLIYIQSSVSGEGVRFTYFT